MENKNNRTILKITLGVLIVMLLGTSTFLVTAFVSDKSPSLEKKSEGIITTGATIQVEDNQVETTDDDNADDKNEVQVSSASAKITEAEAKEIAINEVGGVVTATDTKNVSGKNAWEIEIKTNGKEVDVLVDMETGKVLNVDLGDGEEIDD